MDSAAPTGGGDTADRPSFPGGLSGRQRSLYERLVDHDPDLAAMYAGALSAVESNKPDCFAQAAHSGRELISKLVRLRAVKPESRVGNPRDRARELRDVWARYKRARGVSPDDLRDESIDGPLVDVLRKLEAFSEASRRHKPDRRVQAEQALDGLGLSDADLPESLREADVSEWVELWTFFERASHHGSVLTPEAVRTNLGVLEDLLMRWIPETFELLDEIDYLLAEESDG